MLELLPKLNTHKGKRQGRGYGSGKGGHTTGRGTKGHKSRSGYQSPRPGFEGGQMPLSRRIPKLKGFTRGYFKTHKLITLLHLDKFNVFEDNSEINKKILKEKGIVPSKTMKVKVVNMGRLEKKLQFKDIFFSAKAKENALKAGSTIN